MVKVLLVVALSFCMPLKAQAVSPPSQVIGKSNVKIDQSEFVRLNNSVGEWFINCRKKLLDAKDSWSCIASNNEQIRTYEVYGKDPFTLFARLREKAVEKAVWIKSAHVAKQGSKSDQVDVIKPAAEAGPKGMVKADVVESVVLNQPVVKIDKAEDIAPKVSETRAPVAKASVSLPESVVKSQELAVQLKREVLPEIEEPQPLFAVQLAAFVSKEQAQYFIGKSQVERLEIRETRANGLRWFNVVMKELVSAQYSDSVSDVVQGKTGQRPWVRMISDF